MSKELYQLKPIAWLLVTLSLLSVLSVLMTTRIDEYRFANWCEAYCEPGSVIVYGFFMMIIVMIVAYSLFPTEHDESTIDFLHALPVSRAKIFLSKVTAGVVLLMLLLITDFALSAIMLLANPQSLDGKFYSNIFNGLMLREGIFMFVVLSHGIFLSWFRLPGLLIYAVYLVVIQTLETYQRGVGVANVFSILQIELIDQTVYLNWRAIAVHSFAAVLLLYLSYLLWSRDYRVVDSSTSKPRGRWLAVLGTVFMFMFAALLMAFQATRSTDVEAKAGLESVSTEHYRFVVAKDLRDRLDHILEFADDDYQALVKMLAMQQQPNIQADMTSSNVHALGVASWKKVRMNIEGFETDRFYRRILLHETTHAFQAVESNRQLSEHYNGTKFFIEGMAQYTSFTIVPMNDMRDSNWQLAAVAWKRQGIEFKDVTDFAGFTEQYDENLVYTLGDVWAQAMVDVCSERILGDFLRALDSGIVSGKMSSREFWSRLLEQTACSLEAVIDRWQLLLQESFASITSQEFPIYAEPLMEHDEKANKIRIKVSLEHSPELSPKVSPEVSPGLSPGVTQEAGSTNNESFVLPKSYHLKIRAGSLSDKLPDAVYHGRLLSSGSHPTIEFVVPVSAARQGRVQYQLGYVPTSGERIYFERWRRGVMQ